jgi:hypothetical protein
VGRASLDNPLPAISVKRANTAKMGNSRIG